MGSMRRVKLGDVALVEISGVDKKTNEGEASVRLCNFTDVYKSWAITSSMHDSFMVASANEREIAKFSLHRGQVAVTKDSETRDDIGIPTYIADNFDDVILGYHCALITPDETQLNGKYLNAFLHTEFIHKFFSANASGSGQRYTLSIETLNSIPIYLPSLEEQERIGNIFSSIDRKIELNRQINDYLEAMARQLYDYWFVQFDFPDENGKPYKSSGGKMVWSDKLKKEIPEKWTVFPLFKLSEIINGATPSTETPNNYGGNIVWITPKDLSNQKSKFTYFGERNITQQGYDSCSTTLVGVNTILLSSRAPIGLLSIAKCELCTNQGFKSIEPHDKENTPYLYYYIKEHLPQIEQLGSGTTFKEVSRGDIEGFPVMVPQEKVLSAWSKLIKEVFEKQYRLYVEVVSFSKMRDELLPMLMNGQVSVKSLNNHLSEWGALVFRNVVGFATQGIFQNCLYKVICSKVQGCFMDLTFVFKLHFTDLDRPPVSGLHPTILEMENNLCATLWILWKLLFEFFKGGYLFSLGVSDEVILCLNGEVGRCVPVIGFFKLETRIESAYLVQIEIVFFNPFVIKEVEGMPDIGMYNSSDGTCYLIPPRPA